MRNLISHLTRVAQMKTQSAKSILQRNRTDWHRIGQAKRYIAIHHTDGKCLNGFANVMSIIGGGGTAVMLIPARTDTKAFHEYIYGKAELRFVRGRLKFGGCKNSAPFPSMVVVFKNGNKGECWDGLEG